MIFTERQITVRKGKSSIDEQVILYRGDYEVSIKFTIIESKYRFKSGVNLVDSEKASYGQLAILAPYGGNVFSDVVKCEDGTVTFTLTKEMIDQLEEVGLYSFQIRLFDYYRESRVSIPPVEFGIEVREPVASEDHDNEVNNAIVGYSIAKVVDPSKEDVGDTFDANGNYNKTDWETGDRISEGKLNKIEDALDKINQNEKSLDKKVDSNYRALDAIKANKNEKFSMDNMGQDVREAMTGGSVAVVGKNAVLEENIQNNQITVQKMASSDIFNQGVDYRNFGNVSNTDSIYIMPKPFNAKGYISIIISVNEGITDLYLLSLSSKNVFTVIDSKQYFLKQGVNTIERAFVSNDETELYIGVRASGGLKYCQTYDLSIVGDRGFYEKGGANELYTKNDVLTCADNTSLTSFILGIQVVCSDREIVNDIYNIKDDIYSNIVNINEYNFSNIDRLPFWSIAITSGSIYIPNKPLEYSGECKINIKHLGLANIYVFCLESEPSTFKVKHIYEVNSVGSSSTVTTFVTDRLLKGDYIGISGNIYYGRGNPNPTGFFELTSDEILSNPLTEGKVIRFANTHTAPGSPGYAFEFGYSVEMFNKTIKSECIDVSEVDFSNADFSNVDFSNVDLSNVDLSNVDLPVDTSKINLTDFKLLRYSEIEEQVGFMGRWFDNIVDGVDCKCTINAGSELYFKVKGATAVDVNFKINSVRATPYFGYSIDGGEFIRQLITNPTISGLTTDEHIIRVVIDGLTESEDKYVGEKGIAFYNITVNSGSIKGVIPKNRTIMFFGDSITEGVRALNMNADSNGNSSINAYPFQCCEKLNAVSYRVGFGASGVTKGGSGGVPECLTVIDNMTNSRETPYFEPDAIVINHGTNDGGASSETFKNEYNRVLDRLTIKYPGVPIFAAPPFNQSHSADIIECVANRSNCYLIDTAGWGVTYTDGIHPDANGARIAGEKLADAIVEILGKAYFI